MVSSYIISHQHSGSIKSERQLGKLFVVTDTNAMVCISPSLTVESWDDVSTAAASGVETNMPAYKRRHSSYNPRRDIRSDHMDHDDNLMLRVWPN